MLYSGKQFFQKTFLKNWKRSMRNVCDLTDWVWPDTHFQSLCAAWTGLTCSGWRQVCYWATWGHTCARSPWSGWPDPAVSPAALCSPTSGTGSASLADVLSSVDTSAVGTLKHHEESENMWMALAGAVTFTWWISMLWRVKLGELSVLSSSTSMSSNAFLSSPQ